MSSWSVPGTLVPRPPLLPAALARVGRGIEDAVTGHATIGDARRFEVWEGAFGH